jgi:Domain of unknown function (DUF4407)
MGRLLIWLSGARGQILAECPTERPKYVGIGAAILITGTMAAISLAFALVTALKVALWAALPFAIGWGLAIMSLDRMFVVSMPRRGRWWVQLLRATPRFLLALLLGVVISTPFVLQIFRPEIEHEITQIQDQTAANYFKNLPSSPLSKEIVSEQREIQTLQAEVAGTGAGTSTAQSPELTSLMQQRQQAIANQNSAYQSWQCQLYGPCKPPGDGPLAKADAARYTSYGIQVAGLTTQISKLEQQQQTANKKQQGLVSSSASSQLSQAKRELSADVAEQQRQTADFVGRNKDDTGLLIRLQALGDATAGNTTLQAARWLLFLLFVVIDCMPVVLKLMLNMAPENNYDKMLAAEEVKQLRVASSNRAVRQSAEIIDASTFIEEPRSRIAGWNAEIPAVTQEIIATRERVERERLRAWERDQTHRIRNGWFTQPGGQTVEPERPVMTSPWSWFTGAAARRGSGQRRFRWPGLQTRSSRQNGSPQRQNGPLPGQFGPPPGQFGPPPGQNGPPPGQNGSPGQYGPPAEQYGAPEQYGPPAEQYGPPGQYGPSPGQYTQPEHYGPPGQNGPSPEQ